MPNMIDEERPFDKERNEIKIESIPLGNQTEPVNKPILVEEVSKGRTGSGGKSQNQLEERNGGGNGDQCSLSGYV